MNHINDILRQALYDMAEANDRMGYKAAGDCYREFADRKYPRQPAPTITDPHDSNTCTLGTGGGPCAACVEAARWERKSGLEISIDMMMMTC